MKTPHQSTIERANEAIAAGSIWRAKEILAGSISAGEFNPDIYRHYGELLLKMGDALEAGKFLFISGARAPEYTEALDIFVKRFTRKNHWGVYHAFPARAKFDSLDKYPEGTRKDLKALGYPDSWAEKRPEARPSKLKDKLGALIGFSIFGTLLLCLLVGICVVGLAIVKFFGR